MVVAFSHRLPVSARNPARVAANAARMRLFIALWPDADARIALSKVALRAVSELSAGGRSVAPPNLHMTLAFLGATAADAVPQLLRIMRAARPVTSELHLDHLGYFAAGKVLWLGSEHPVPALLHAQRRLAGGLRQAGFPTENRTFKPHVTLARDCQRPDLAGHMPLAVRWHAKQFALVESLSVPGGVRYRVIETITA